MREISISLGSSMKCSKFPLSSGERSSILGCLCYCVIEYTHTQIGEHVDFPSGSCSGKSFIVQGSIVLSWSWLDPVRHLRYPHWPRVFWHQHPETLGPVSSKFSWKTSCQEAEPRAFKGNQQIDLSIASGCWYVRHLEKLRILICSALMRDSYFARLQEGEVPGRPGEGTIPSPRNEDVRLGEPSLRGDQPEEWCPPSSPGERILNVCSRI